MTARATHALERGVSLGLRVSWRIVRAIAAVVIVAAVLGKGRR